MADKSTYTIVKDSILIVGILLCLILLLVRGYYDSASKNIALVSANQIKTDSINEAYKKVDAATAQAKISADVATAVTKSNRELQHKIDSTTETNNIVIGKIEDKVEKHIDDVNYLQTDINLLAAQRDSLIELNRKLVFISDSLQHSIQLIAKADTAKSKAKPQPVFNPPYFFGQRQPEELKPPRLAFSLGLNTGYYWWTRATTAGLGMTTTLSHLRLYNGFYYNFQAHQVRGNTNLNIDLFTVSKRKKK